MPSNLLIKNKIIIIGIGYVGLPLALSLAKKGKVFGYDVSKKKVDDLNRGFDSTNQFKAKDLKSKNLIFTNDTNFISKSKIIIVTVPTPVNKKNVPNLTDLKNACNMIGKKIKIGSTIIFESTVYPGLTEEICIKILEKNSKLKWKKDFFVGYSPERINPGDKNHVLKNITKVISGDSKKTINLLKTIYSKISKKLHVAETIKVAEAAKIIENIQRDINIALINEFSIILSKMKIDVYDVLKAAGTKWNFLNFKPGLVGGHCIGVDPYYLTYKAKQLGYYPKVILSGRKINDGMKYEIIKKFYKLNKLYFTKKKLNILILGITFKEDCNDFRNSKPIEVLKILKKNKQFNIDVFDPVVDKKEIFIKEKIKIKKPVRKKYDVAMMLVSHKKFREIGIKKLKFLLKDKSYILDIKNQFNSNESNFHTL